jgi:cysteinyl-tRNA synthetase
MISDEHKTKFLAAVNDDLNMPRAMAAVQELLKSNISDGQKYTSILEFDRVLGLDLDRNNGMRLTACEMKFKTWAIWSRIHRKG